MALSGESAALLDALRSICDAIQSSTLRDEQCMRKLNQALPTLINSQLSLSRDLATMKEVLQVIARVAHVGAADTGVLCDVLERARDFIAEPSLYPIHDAMHEALATILSLFRTQDYALFHAYATDVVALALGALESATSDAPGPTLACFARFAAVRGPQGPQCPQGPQQPAAEALSTNAQWGPQGSQEAYSMDVQSSSRLQCAVAWSLGMGAVLCERMPSDVWESALGLWRLLPRAVALAHARPRAAALRLLREMLRRYDAPLGLLEELVFAVLDVARFSVSSSHREDADVAGECLQIAYSKLEPESVCSLCGALMRAVREVVVDPSAPAAAAAAGASPQCPPLLAASLLGAAQATARHCWALAAPAVCEFAARIGASRDVQVGVCGCLQSILCQCALSAAAATARPASSSPSLEDRGEATPELPELKRPKRAAADAQREAGAAEDMAVDSAARAAASEPQHSCAATCLASLSQAVADTRKVRAAAAEAKTAGAVLGLVLRVDMFFRVAVLPPDRTTQPWTGPAYGWPALDTREIAGLGALLRAVPAARELERAAVELLAPCVDRVLEACAGCAAREDLPQLLVAAHALAGLCKANAVALQGDVLAPSLRFLFTAAGDGWIAPGLADAAGAEELARIADRVACTAVAGLALCPVALGGQRVAERLCGALASKRTLVRKAALAAAPLVCAFHAGQPEDVLRQVVGLGTSDADGSVRCLALRLVGHVACAAAHSIAAKEGAGGGACSSGSSARGLSPYFAQGVRCVDLGHKVGSPWWIDLGASGLDDERCYVLACPVCDALPPRDRAAASSDKPGCKKRSLSGEFLVPATLAEEAQPERRVLDRGVFEALATKVLGAQPAVVDDGFDVPTVPARRSPSGVAATPFGVPLPSEACSAATARLPGSSRAPSAEPEASAAAAALHSVARVLCHAQMGPRAAMGRLFDLSQVFLWHRDSRVRMSMARAMCEFGRCWLARAEAEAGAADAAHTVDAFARGLREAIGFQENDADCQEAILVMLGQLGCHATGEFLACIFLTELNYLQSKQAGIATVAFEQLRTMAKYKGMSLKKLANEFAGYIGNEYIPRICECQELLEKICRLVLEVDFAAFLDKNISAVLPMLVLRRNELPIKKIAAEVGRNEANVMCYSRAPAVVSWILLHAQDAQQEAALQFFCDLTGNDYASILRSYASEIVREIVDVLYDESLLPRVNGALLSMAAVQHPDAKCSPDELISEYLRGNKFLYLMDHLARSYKSPERKERVLVCLNRLLPLVGSKVHIPKVLSFLKQATSTPAMQSLALDVWYTFLRLLDVSALGKDLNEIVSSVVTALAVVPDKVARVLELLIVDHRDELHKYFHTIQFIPDVAATSRVRQIISTQLPSDWKMSLDLQLRGLQLADSSDNKKLALAKIKQQLSDHRELYKLLAGDRADPIISSLVHELLHVMRDPDESVQLVSTECLGELGAVDPGKIDVRLRPSLSAEEGSVYEVGRVLVAEYLVKALRKNSQHQDYAAVAIQQVLAALGVSSRTRRPEGAQFWERLPEETRAVVAQYLTTDYCLAQAPRELPVPVWRPATSYRAWVEQWTNSLIARVCARAEGGGGGGAAAGGTEAAALFCACSAVVRDDLPTALYILPLLVLSVLRSEQPEDHSIVVDEITAVLQYEGAHSESWQQCAQCVFQLLDWLNKRADCSPPASAGAAARGLSSSSRAGGSSSSRRAREASEQSRAITQILARIPQLVVAMAAKACRAHARALLHFEGHARAEIARLGGPANISAASVAKDMVLKDHMGFLRQVYGNLEDLDGLVGVATLRVAAPLVDQIADLESSGRWYEALTHYDVCVRSSPDDALRVGRLLCLRDLGHLDTMLSVVHSELSALPARQQQTQPQQQPAPVPHSASASGAAAFGRGAPLEAQLLACGVQAAWRLCSWESLARFSAAKDVEQSGDWEVFLGRAFLEMHRRAPPADVARHVCACRRQIAPALAAASNESYQRCYPELVKLHVLRDVERFHEAAQAGGQAQQQQQQQLLDEWQARLRTTQRSFRAREPILNSRRVAHQIADMREQVAATWLSIARLARKTGGYQTARNAVLQAKELVPGELMEEAKLEWEQGKPEQAVRILRSLFDKAHKAEVRTRINGMGSEGCSDAASESAAAAAANRELAKAKLRMALWKEASGDSTAEKDWKDVVALDGRWEKGYFFLARYYDGLVTAAQAKADRREKTRAMVELIPAARNAVRHYSHALQYGAKYVYHSLPRLLTLWFTYGSLMAPRKSPADAPEEQQRRRRGSSSSAAAAAAAEEAEEQVSRHISAQTIKYWNLMTETVALLTERVPAYVLLTGLSQLNSRLCHRNEDVWRALVLLLTKLVHEYPQQALWSLTGMLKSKHQLRKKRAELLIAQARKQQQQQQQRDGAAGAAALTAVHEEMSRIADLLIDVCNYMPAKGAASRGAARQFLLSHTRMRALTDIREPRVLAPLQSSFAVALPAKGAAEGLAGFRPFAGSLPLLASAVDAVEVLNSMQAPKKLLFHTTAGRDAMFLLKPKDDLRRDARMMEIYGVINKTLSQDQDARRRNLYIRTYSVVPLNEECGIIEWVPNTTAMKAAINAMTGPAPMTSEEIKQAWESPDPKEKAQRFLEVVARHPPMLHRWFVSTFPEPYAWFEARLSYTRTTAVMSAVGLCVGLGDRHCENLLLDSTTGDTVHVDMNALFWKGEGFNIPECVPFRLTQNMVDAMGLCGVEGGFRSTAEITMRLLRANHETLLSVLEGFVYDPLLEWSRGSVPASGECENTTGVESLKCTARILQGKPKKEAEGAAQHRALSVTEQVSRAIAEAQSPENLSRMYMGWTPFI
eukprot:m51a1_g5857 hypothetical protein (2841) ;mRNA; r:365248-375650